MSCTLYSLPVITATLLCFGAAACPALGQAACPKPGMLTYCVPLVPCGCVSSIQGFVCNTPTMILPNVTHPVASGPSSTGFYVSYEDFCYEEGSCTPLYGGTCDPNDNPCITRNLHKHGTFTSYRWSGPPCP